MLKPDPRRKMKRVILRMILTAIVGSLGIVLCIVFFFKGAYVCAILSAFLGMMLMELVHFLLSDK